MKKYKVTSTRDHPTSIHFSFNGIRRYDFEANGSLIVTNEHDVEDFKNSSNFLLKN